MQLPNRTPKMFPHYPMINANVLRTITRNTRGNRFGGLGAVDNRYIPVPSQILDTPTAGYWYQIKRGETWWKVAKSAYGSNDLKKGLLLMNAATWNDHITRKKTGWEAYNRKGLQATPDYSLANPHAPAGSGKDYPVAWIPPLSGQEPESLFPSTIGPPGERGDKGATGSRGPAGPKGDRGPKGDQGPKGPKGDRGPKGTSGSITDAQIMAALNDYMRRNPAAAGARGPAGPKGDRGPEGPRGPVGPAGTSGSITDAQIMAALNDYMRRNPAAAGARGPKGDRGPEGPRGKVGPVGPRGPAGSGGGGGDDKKMWVLPLVTAMATM
jgi:hypothetical protein